MDRESPEVIQHEMEQTRASLTDKVAALENQVVGTFQNATETVQNTVDTVQSTVQSLKSAVEDTVSNVKDTVSESVESVTDQVKSVFDVSQHVQKQPWAMVGGAAMAGLVTGLVVFRQSSGVRNSDGAIGYQPPASGPSLSEETHGFSSYSAPTGRVAAASSRMPSWIDGLLSQAGQEVRKLAEEALATAVASLKQSLQTGLKDNIPHLVDTGMQKVTEKVAGGLGATGPGAGASPGSGYRPNSPGHV